MYLTTKISKDFLPPGAINSTVSPTSLPIKALAIGEEREIKFFSISAS